MPGGKGKSIGGKGGSKDSAGKNQKSHSAKAGLQVSYYLFPLFFLFFSPLSLLKESCGGFDFFWFLFVWG